MSELTSTQCRFDIGSCSEDGVFSGYAAVFHSADYQNDILLPGAFCYSKSIKLLWQHDYKEPIGKVIGVSEDSKGLFLTAKLVLEVSKAMDAYFLLKNQAIDGLSIGYIPISYYIDEKRSARVLECVEIWEVSIVTFPCNPGARVTSVKNRGNFSHYEHTTKQIDQILSLMSP